METSLERSRRAREDCVKSRGQPADPDTNRPDAGCRAPRPDRARRALLGAPLAAHLARARFRSPVPGPFVVRGLAPCRRLCALHPPHRVCRCRRPVAMAERASPHLADTRRRSPPARGRFRARAPAARNPQRQPRARQRQPGKPGAVGRTPQARERGAGAARDQAAAAGHCPCRPLCPARPRCRLCGDRPPLCRARLEFAPSCRLRSRARRRVGAQCHGRRLDHAARLHRRPRNLPDERGKNRSQGACRIDPHGARHWSQARAAPAPPRAIFRAARGLACARAVQGPRPPAPSRSTCR